MINNCFTILSYDIFWLPILCVNFIFVLFININKVFTQFFLQLNFQKNNYNLSLVYNNFIKSYDKYYYFIFNILFLALSFLLFNNFILLSYANNTIFFVFSLTNLVYFNYTNFLVIAIFTLLMLRAIYQVKFFNFYEHLLSIFLLLISLFYYIFVNNLIAFIFILELQSILFIYLLSTNYNINTYFTDILINTKLKIYNINSTWYFNALIYQFWVSFFGSVLLFYGVLMILKNTYIFEWSQFDILYYFYFFLSLDVKLYYFNFSIIIIGFLLKLGIFPFFVWKPEVYKNVTITTLFVYMFSYLSMFLIIFLIFFTSYFVLTIQYWFYYFYLMIYLTLLILPFFIYSITELRVFLAYISVIHVLLILFSAISLTYSSLNIAYLYWFSYIIFTLNFFVLMFSITTNSLWYLTDLQYFSSIPIINTAILVLFLNYAGLPPILGFFSKILILFSFIVNNDYLIFIILLLINFFFIYFYLQNYRFLGFSLSTYDYNHRFISFTQILNYVNYFIFFIFFSVFSIFLFSDLLIFCNFNNFLL